MLVRHSYFPSIFNPILHLEISMPIFYDKTHFIQKIVYNHNIYSAKITFPSNGQILRLGIHVCLVLHKLCP